MHEFSIVQSIVDIARDEMKKNHAHTVDKIELEIGTMAGVEFDALDFAWEVAVKDTILQKTEKIVNKVQAHARCLGCGCEYRVNELFQACPACGEVFVEYLKGKELRVKSLVVS